MSKEPVDSSTHQTIQVSIFNRVYKLRSGGGHEHVTRVARIVDERMRLISANIVTHDIAKIAILAALQIADELEQLKGQQESEGRARDDDAGETGGGSHESAGGNSSRSWFEDIFDGIGAMERGERLSDGITAKLRPTRQPEQDKGNGE